MELWYIKTPKAEEVRGERVDLGVGVQGTLGRKVMVHRGKWIEWEASVTPFVPHCHMITAERPWWTLSERGWG